MKKKPMELLSLINKFLQERITAKKFEKEFSKFFFDNRNLFKKELSNECYDILEDLDTDLGFFESNHKIRKESNYYFDEKILRKKVKKVFDKINKRLKE